MKIRNILLVEDDQLDVIDFRRALDKLNVLYSLVVAKNGEEAIELLNKEGTPQLEHLPDFLLIDINMPKMNGLEFLEIVRNTEKWKHLKCFIITTSDEDVDRDAANRLGVSGYIVKPFKINNSGSMDSFNLMIDLINN
ncbi:response regulator [Flavitalea antarctica]